MAFWTAVYSPSLLNTFWARWSHLLTSLQLQGFRFSNWVWRSEISVCMGSSCLSVAALNSFPDLSAPLARVRRPSARVSVASARVRSVSLLVRAVSARFRAVLAQVRASLADASQRVCSTRYPISCPCLHRMCILTRLPWSEFDWIDIFGFETRQCMFAIVVRKKREVAVTTGHLTVIWEWVDYYLSILHELLDDDLAPLWQSFENAHQPSSKRTRLWTDGGIKTPRNNICQVKPANNSKMKIRTVSFLVWIIIYVLSIKRRCITIAWPSLTT